MKALLKMAAMAMMLTSTALGQTSYFNQGLLRQPSAAADIAYLGLTASAITNGMNGIIYGDGVGFGVVTIGGGLVFAGGVLSAPGGAGTVTTFSAGNLSPLFTTSVANPNTTPALSFAQVSQNANLVFASPDAVPGNPSFRALVSGDIPPLAYVTSVGLALPVSVFAVSGSPVTGAGTLTGAFQNQNANTVFAGPTTGVPATPAFRALVAADVPPTVFTNHSDVVPSTLQAGDIIAYDGATWTNGQPVTGGGSTSLPGLLVRPVSALVSGTLQAPTWPDDDTYYVDDEFDTWQGSSSGQFGRLKWTATANGGGGTVLNVSSNAAPHYGVIALQSPTTINNTFLITAFGATGSLPYAGLGLASNWLYHAVFMIGITNTGSIYRLGLEDSGFANAGLSMNPSNCVMLRWDRNKNDPDNFIFEARSNATVTLGNSSVRPVTNVFYKLTFMCTNAGVVLCQINNENWVTISNIPTASVGLAAMDSSTNGVAQFLHLDRVSFMSSSMGR